MRKPRSRKRKRPRKLPRQQNRLQGTTVRRTPRRLRKMQLPNRRQLPRRLLQNPLSRNLPHRLHQHLRHRLHQRRLLQRSPSIPRMPPPRYRRCSMPRPKPPQRFASNLPQMPAVTTPRGLHCGAGLRRCRPRATGRPHCLRPRNPRLQNWPPWPALETTKVSCRAPNQRSLRRPSGSTPNTIWPAPWVRSESLMMRPTGQLLANSPVC